MSRLSRRVFIGGSLAACGGLALPAFASPVRRLRFGVLTDVHIHEDYRPSTDVLEKELRWLDAQGVEAVVFPGDIANNGRVAELERFAATWEKVFPNFTAADGRRVERIVVSGNHDLFTDEVRLNWERVLGEKWERIWKCEVKGITFVCAQHGRQGPGREIGAWFRGQRESLKGLPAFIYVQHAHPRNTCHGEFAIEGRAADEGWSTAALAEFPNAIALSGHSHIALTDERMVWQGGFTSIGCGCSGVIVPTGLGYRRANGGMPGGKGRARLQPPAFMYGSDAPYTKPGDLKIPRETVPTMQDGRAGLVIDLYDDRLVLHRRSFFFDEPVGEDWTVPLPASAGGPFDFTVRAAKRRAPQFAAAAEVKVESFVEAPEEAGDDYRGKKPCIRISYPCANAEKDGRVFDYAVTAIASGKRLFTRELIARDFHLPKQRAGLGGYCLLEPESVPMGQKIVFEVVPRDEFGTAGRAIRSKPFERGRLTKALDLLLTCYKGGGKVLTCGNGGSAADAEHIVGELLKKFRRHRDVSPEIAAKLPPELGARLEGALPAVSLVSMSGILTAFANDVAWETAFAQQVYGLGNPGDVLIALSTSGNSVNCVNAALVAKAKGMKVVSMTGAGGGKLGDLADAAIKVPETETYKIQELHLPVYHALCAAIEEMLF